MRCQEQICVGEPRALQQKKVHPNNRVTAVWSDDAGLQQGRPGASRRAVDPPTTALADLKSVGFYIFTQYQFWPYIGPSFHEELCF